MGMFDILYDQHGNEWQTKAYGCLLDSYHIDDELPGPPIDYQVEIMTIFLARAGEPHHFVESYATARKGALSEVHVPRDHSLPLMDYDGGWPKPERRER